MRSASSPLVQQPRQLNTSLFYIDLSDQQVTQVPPTANTVIRNAGKSRSMGLSGSLRADHGGPAFRGQLRVYGRQYRRYSDKVSGMDYAGNRTPLAPNTYNLALQYSLPLLESFDFFHKEDSLTITRAELQGVGSSTGTTPTPSSRIRMSW